MIHNRLKISFYSLLTLIIVLLTSMMPNMIVDALPEDKKVYDGHDLFTDDEELALEETLSKLSEEGKVDILIITSSSTNGLSRQVYLEDFYDENGPGYEQNFGTATLMLLNMDPNDRGVEIQGYYNAEHYVTNQRIMDIISDIKPDLSAGNYYDAVIDYANQVVNYMSSKPSTPSSNYNNNNSTNNNYYHNGTNTTYYNNSNQSYKEESVLANPIVQLIISLIIGGVVVGIMAANSGGKTTTNSNTYLNSNKIYIPVQRDIYLRTSVTKTKKPDNDNNSSSGGISSGGGTSSGGHSHSGGGSSF